MSANFDNDNFMNFSEEDDQLWNLLSAYVDGETTAAESALVEAHLRSDAAYAQDFAFLKAASRQVIQMGDVEPPMQLREAIFAATVNKPTLSRRLAQAMGQFQAAFLPRYALPTGALAAGVVAAFLLMPRTADTKSGNSDMEPSQIAAIPSNPVSEPKISDVTPQVEATTPKTNTATQKTITQNDSPKVKVIVPKQSEIDWTQVIAPTQETIKVEKKVADTKLNIPKFKVIPANLSSKSSTIAPKIQPRIVQSTPPMPKMSDMYNDFTPIPNMDRGNQRNVASNGTPTEPLPGEDVTPTTADAAPTANAAGTENSAVVPVSTRTVRLRSGRTLPDSRRIATAAQFRSEESEFQKGMSRNTMLAIQRDELSGSTVTRF